MKSRPNMDEPGPARPSPPESSPATGSSGLSYAFGALGGGIRGYELGVVAGALLFAAPALRMAPLTVGWVVSSALLGSLVGALGAGPLSDTVGRRAMIAAAAMIFIAGIIGAAVAPDVTVLIIARLTLGVAVGIATSLIPVYIGEIAPAGDRGAFVGLFQVMIATGVLASSVVTLLLVPYGAWRAMFAVGVLPALAMLAGVFLIPESPRWLVRQGRAEAAAAVLRRLRRRQDVSQELADIEAIAAQEGRKLRLRSVLSRPRLRRLLIVGCGLGALQQLVGINAVTYYAPSVLKSIGFSNAEAITFNLGFSLLGLVMTVIMAALVVDRYGRRKPLMLGALGMALSMALLGAIFGTTGMGGLAGWIAICGLALFQASFALSWGGIVWIVLGELFPLGCRGAAVGLCVFCTEITSVAVGVVFPVLLSAGPAVIFFGFAVMGLLAFFWAALMVPETKGPHAGGDRAGPLRSCFAMTYSRSRVSVLTQVALLGIVTDAGPRGGLSVWARAARVGPRSSCLARVLDGALTGGSSSRIAQFRMPRRGR